MVSTLHSVCAKVFLIILDILYLGFGVALLGVGIWLRIDKDAKDLRVVMDTFLGNKLSDAATWLLIAIGIVVILIAVLGLVSAIFEWRALLGLFAALLVVMLGVEAAACALAAIYKEDLSEDLKENMRKTIKQTYYGNEYGPLYATENVGEPWNFLQGTFECCGIEGSNDYDINFRVNYSMPFPYSCCKLRQGSDLQNPLANDTANYDKCKVKDVTYFHPEGCYDKLDELAEENTIIVLGFAIALACFTVFLFVFAICLCVNMGLQEDQDNT